MCVCMYVCIYIYIYIACRLRTNGVNTYNKSVSGSTPKSPSVKKLKLRSDPVGADPICPSPEPVGL